MSSLTKLEKARMIDSLIQNEDPELHKLVLPILQTCVVQDPDTLLNRLAQQAEKKQLNSKYYKCDTKNKPQNETIPLFIGKINACAITKDEYASLMFYLRLFQKKWLKWKPQEIKSTHAHQKRKKKVPKSKSKSAASSAASESLTSEDSANLNKIVQDEKNNLNQVVKDESKKNPTRYTIVRALKKRCSPNLTNIQILTSTFKTNRELSGIDSPDTEYTLLIDGKASLCTVTWDEFQALKQYQRNITRQYLKHGGMSIATLTTLVGVYYAQMNRKRLARRAKNLRASVRKRVQGLRKKVQGLRTRVSESKLGTKIGKVYKDGTELYTRSKGEKHYISMSGLVTGAIVIVGGIAYKVPTKRRTALLYQVKSWLGLTEDDSAFANFDPNQ